MAALRWGRFAVGALAAEGFVLGLGGIDNVSVLGPFALLRV